MVDFGKQVPMKRPGQPAELATAYRDARRSALKLHVRRHDCSDRREAHPVTAEPDQRLEGATEAEIRNGFRKAALFKQLGPGLVTGAADDDPSGIATYSQAGAQFGFNMLWTMALTYPLMTAVQFVSAQIGRVTGCGLAKNIGGIFPKPLVLGLSACCFSPTRSISAPISPRWGQRQNSRLDGVVTFQPSASRISLTLQMFIPYERYARISNG